MINLTNRLDGLDVPATPNNAVDTIQTETRTKMQEWANTVGDLGISFTKASADLAKKSSEAMEQMSQRIPDIASNTGSSVRNLFKGVKKGWDALWEDKSAESTTSQN